MTIEFSQEPVLTFPEKEAAFLKHHYHSARVILEYGAGGSTLVAARLPGRYVISVESDRRWAMGLQQQIDEEKLSHGAVIQYCDIGPTGDWGRPMDETHWRRYYRYPCDIWSRDFFRHPDVVLIDGRFRAACFVATFLRITRPVSVLFDDYVDRAAYHIVEKLAKPVAIAGRMAHFRLHPGPRPIWVHDLFMELLGDVTLGTDTRFPYPAHDQDRYPLRPDLKLS